MTNIQKLKYKKLQKQYSNTEWKYMAVDRNGSVWVYIMTPTARKGRYVWDAPNRQERIIRFNTEIPNWRQTLVELNHD